jgi:signal transduction histidine kinase
MTAYATIAPLKWSVFVEQPLEEAFESLYASIQRTIVLLVVGVVLSVAAGLILARRLVTPIRALQAGAARIGTGELDQRIDVRTGDELEALGDQFNSMAAQLKESYAGLERKVEERTHELTESLERQTATGEILRVISSSPTDTQPVFDAILDSATRLCSARHGILFLYDHGAFRTVACRGLSPEAERVFREPVPRPGPTTGLGRMLAERRPIQIADVTDDIAYRQGDPLRVRTVEFLGARSGVWLPLLKADEVVGALSIYRQEVRPFSDKQIELVQTFADQAVIAIENVRLFQELQMRTRELARSVHELQALGEVGRAVSSTLDLETVLSTIVSQASQLSGTDGGAIYEYDEETEEFQLRATQNFGIGFVDLLRSTRIRKGEGAVGRMAVTFEPTQIPDIEQDATYQSRLRDAALREGYHALLAVPLLREHRIVGGLIVNRRAPGEFAPDVIELLRTFAAQSALAIQNAQLFQEIEEKSRQLEVADRHKSEFLASMSHELRTPLNAVIGFSEVLLDRMFGELNPKQDEYLQDILTSGRHLLSLINDILDLAKIEAGRMELEVTDFHLPQAIDNSITLIRERAARRAITLAVDVDPRLGEIKGDERKVKQVLLNLLSNAIKFTPEGGRVVVQAGLADGFAEISVTDTGVGIAPEDHEAVFEEFRQVGSDYAKKHEGTGLGLTLSRRFVELHGGRIWVKSQLGQGSTFTFTLPVKPWQTS